MIRGAPSISTTGIAGDSTRAEVRHQVGLASGAEQLLALVATDLGEDVYRSGHIRWRRDGSRDPARERPSAS